MLSKIARLLPLIALLLVTLPALAQEGGRVLAPGTPVTGILNENAIVQVYTLEGQANQVLSVLASNEIGVPLALILTDASGNALAQVVDTEVTGTSTLSGITLPEDGLYYVTVFKAGGVQSVSEVTFTLALTLEAAGTQPAATAEPTAEAVTPEATGEQPATAEATLDFGQVVTTSGMQISLTWNSTDDLDLEVRDPVGGSLYWETPTVASGGALSANINQGCEVTTAQSPTESATWSPGGVPTGSYEVIVYFQESCAGNNPVTFTVTPTIDGVALTPIEATLLPTQTFVGSFRIAGDGSGTINPLRGVVSDDLPASAAEIIAGAQPIELGAFVNGQITTSQPYQAYRFSAAANDLVTISMNADTGSLDPFLFLLDAAGNIIGTNDDLGVGATDSLISNALLPAAGDYTIVASRYAKALGGTEGAYTLSLNTQATDLPEAFLNLPRGLLEVRLLWNSNADLQLLVRDSSGNAVFDDSPTIRSGGTLAAAGNVNCTVPTGTPFSYIYWPTNTPPRPGSYEVEVWFQNECNDPAPVSFNLYVTYNGREIFSDTAQPLVGDRYLTSFTIQADGTALPSEGGIITGIDSLNYQSELENALPISATEPRNGSITFDNKFDLYVFSADAGSQVSISMNNTSGTLDPTLYLIGPSGILVAENDDAVAGENTNSLIADLTLPESGQYIIIATHFGALYGGTTGTYTLTLTQ
ncbi:MAG: PPC domain-containing protein [Chloroflexi bacterium]|nr:PPC domain-containing protein [Chloroflexota bacterium]